MGLFLLETIKILERLRAREGLESSLESPSESVVLGERTAVVRPSTQKTGMPETVATRDCG